MKKPVLRRVLVPTDFTPNARAALDWAMTLGRKFDAEIRVFHAGVVPPVTYADFVTWPIGPIEEAAKNAMQTLITASTKDYPGIEGGVRVGIGAADEILREVEEWKADLVVMSSHGRRGLSRLFMGSVAETVLRHSAVPVFIVRPTEEG
jgi:nucleotide-binding universal stress UspA family protein